jgi:hypothetical protein
MVKLIAEPMQTSLNANKGLQLQTLDGVLHRHGLRRATEYHYVSGHCGLYSLQHAINSCTPNKAPSVPELRSIAAAKFSERFNSDPLQATALIHHAAWHDSIASGRDSGMQHRTGNVTGTQAGANTQRTDLVMDPYTDSNQVLWERYLAQVRTNMWADASFLGAICEHFGYNLTLWIMASQKANHVVQVSQPRAWLHIAHLTYGAEHFEPVVPISTPAKVGLSMAGGSQIPHVAPTLGLRCGISPSLPHPIESPPVFLGKTLYRSRKTCSHPTWLVLILRQTTAYRCLCMYMEQLHACCMEVGKPLGVVRAQALACMPRQRYLRRH